MRSLTLLRKMELSCRHRSHRQHSAATGSTTAGEDRHRTASWVPRALSTSFDLCFRSMCRMSTCGWEDPHLPHQSGSHASTVLAGRTATIHRQNMFLPFSLHEAVQPDNLSTSCFQSKYPLKGLRIVPIILIHGHDGHAVRLLPLAKLLQSCLQHIARRISGDWLWFWPQKLHTLFIGGSNMGDQSRGRDKRDEVTGVVQAHRGQSFTFFAAFVSPPSSPPSDMLRYERCSK